MLPEPIYQDNQVVLYQGDALLLFPSIPDASVQLIIVDPPYYKVKTTYRGQRIEWDRQWKTPQTYLAWLQQLAKEWQRVLVPNGSLYCFAAPEMAAHIEVMMGELFTVLNQIRWVKDAGWHNKSCKEEIRAYLSPWEAIIFCEQCHTDAMALDAMHYVTLTPLGHAIRTARVASGKRGTDVDIALGYTRSKDPHRGTELCRRWEEGSSIPSELDYCRALTACGDGRSYEALRADYEALRADYEALRRPFTLSAHAPYTDVWDFQTVSAAPGKHPCEKPLPLLRHMIEVSSRPGDLILDCCAGSASTLDAARQCGRNAIGFELERQSCRLAYERLRQGLLWEEAIM